MLGLHQFYMRITSPITSQLHPAVAAASLVMALQRNFFTLLDDDDKNDDPMPVIARAGSPR
eukprot:c41417_g1_i1 orf=191-373(+)